MRDHQRILGWLFLAWAALQAVGAVVVAVSSAGDLGSPALAALATVVLVAAYAWAGVRLLKRDTKIRVPAIVLSAVMLLSFPVGTAAGVYSLWVLFRRPVPAGT